MRDRRECANVGPARSRADLVGNMTAEWQLRVPVDGVPIGDLSTHIFVGRTPARADYLSGDDLCDALASGEVSQVVKVGNLTGAGIDWKPGDRSFARCTATKRMPALQVGDIVTTATAHHPRYIGAKVDIVDCVPPGFENRVVASAEVMVIRIAREKLNPVSVLLWLRSEAGRQAIQSCVTGQTAHLHASDVRRVVVPTDVVTGDFTDAASLVETGLVHRRAAEAAAMEAVRLFEHSLGHPDNSERKAAEYPSDRRLTPELEELETEPTLFS